jgi:hypothetical protein
VIVQCDEFFNPAVPPLFLIVCSLEVDGNITLIRVIVHTFLKYFMKVPVDE